MGFLRRYVRIITRSFMLLLGVVVFGAFLNKGKDSGFVVGPAPAAHADSIGAYVPPPSGGDAQGAQGSC